MNKKYICEICNYSSNRHSNYNRHMASKKHVNKATNNITLNTEKLIKNTKINHKPIKSFQCNYCYKEIIYKKNLMRHYNNCKSYKNYLIEQLQENLKEKNTIIVELNNTINVINKQASDKDELVYNMINKLNNFSKKRKKKRTRRQKIPATVRNTIWKLHVGNKTETKCFCCSVEPITKGNFDCGHIISDSEGGKIKLDNLRPICGLCNKSMGTQDMMEFMKEFGYDYLKLEL